MVENCNDSVSSQLQNRDLEGAALREEERSEPGSYRLELLKEIEPTNPEGFPFQTLVYEAVMGFDGTDEELAKIMDSLKFLYPSPKLLDDYEYGNTMQEHVAITMTKNYCEALSNRRMKEDKIIGDRLLQELQNRYQERVSTIAQQKRERENLVPAKVVAAPIKTNVVISEDLIEEGEGGGKPVVSVRFEENNVVEKKSAAVPDDRPGFGAFILAPDEFETAPIVSPIYEKVTDKERYPGLYEEKKTFKTRLKNLLFGEKKIEESMEDLAHAYEFELKSFGLIKEPEPVFNPLSRRMLDQQNEVFPPVMVEEKASSFPVNHNGIFDSIELGAPLHGSFLPTIPVLKRVKSGAARVGGFLSTIKKKRPRLINPRTVDGIYDI